MPEILNFPVEISLDWHFREVFLICAPMRRRLEKLSWVHTVNKTIENANRAEGPLNFGRKTREFRRGMGALQPKISVTAQRPGITGKCRR